MPFAQESKIAVSCSFMMIHFLPGILIFFLSPKTLKSLPAVTLQISHSRIFVLLRLQPATAPSLGSRVLFQDSPKRSRRERDSRVRRGTSHPAGSLQPPCPAAAPAPNQRGPTSPSYGRWGRSLSLAAGEGPGQKRFIQLFASQVSKGRWPHAIPLKPGGALT